MPTATHLRVLLAEGRPEEARRIQALVEDASGGPVQVLHAGSLEQALASLASGGIDAVLLDVSLPDGKGFDGLELIQCRFPALPVLLLVSSPDDAESALALRRGAQDCLARGRLDPGLLVRALRFAVERKRSELGLRESEERFELLARATHDVVWDWDLGTRKLWWKVGMASFLGYPQDALGTAEEWWQERVHPADRGRIVSGLQAVIDGGGRFWIEEYRFLAADGSYASVFARGYVIQDGQGAPVRVIGAMTDVTARKRADEGLRETNNMLRTLIQASPLGIVMMDPQMRVRTWNPAAEQILGWSSREMVGNPIPRMTAAQGDGITEVCGLVLQGETLSGREFRSVRKAGGAVDLSVSMAPLRDGMGTILGAMAVISDISELKLAEGRRLQLEEQLRVSQKMEAVGRLAGGVAHDFNNLLTAITGFAELLLARFPAGEAGWSEADEILRSAKRASELTRQLLAFGRRQVRQPRTLDLNEVLKGMEGLLRRLVGEQIDLRTLPSPKLGSVRADQGQMEQVIVNLAVNARDAMPRGGLLTIETRDVALDEHYSSRHGRLRSGPHVLLSICDSGAGMDEETQSHLFEPFYTTKENRSGLGLASVYGIVKQSGGDIWVYSEVGRGSCFKIYLPAVGQAPEAASPPEPAAQVRKGFETVLLAEDSDVVRSLLRQLIRSNGYTILEARDGAAALQLARGFPGKIDLLVTDMVMPGMGGRELAENLSPLRPNMKILYMSGYTEGAILRNGVLAPGTRFIEKPFSNAALLTKIREVLDS